MSFDVVKISIGRGQKLKIGPCGRGFLPSDAYCVRAAIAMRVCDVTICVSVTLMYCAQTTESIIMRPSDRRSDILVSPTPIGLPSTEYALEVFLK